MRTHEQDGWVWSSQIGLWYGEGPAQETEQVCRPVMTSPWWVVHSDLWPDDGAEPTFVRIFPYARRAMEHVAQVHDVVLPDRLNRAQWRSIKEAADA